MSKPIIEDFEKKAKFKDEDEALIIRQKLEQLVSSILTEVTNKDGRLESTLLHCGSVYEGVKVIEPNELDFMVRINLLTNKLSLHPCNSADGYVKLKCDDARWRQFHDTEGFFNPNKLVAYFKKLVNESWSAIEVPEGLATKEISPDEKEGSWGVVYTGLCGGDVMYLESHGPATTA